MTDSTLPAVTDRAAWQAQIDELRTREKAHTREGDAIAAARRRLPMVEVDPATPLTGEHGQVPLLDVFEGRRQLITYFHMWHDGKPTEEQCEGCTFFTGHVRELSYLHSRDVTYATFCQGTYEESAPYHDFMGWEMPWYSARDRATACSTGPCTAGRRSGETPRPAGRSCSVPRVSSSGLMDGRPRSGRDWADATCAGPAAARRTRLPFWAKVPS